MPIVTLQLPVVKRKNKTRPQKCRYCRGETFQLLLQSQFLHKFKRMGRMTGEIFTRGRYFSFPVPGLSSLAKIGCEKYDWSRTICHCAKNIDFTHGEGKGP